MTVNPIYELLSRYDSYLAVCHLRDRVEGVKRLRLFDATDVPWASSGRQAVALVGFPVPDLPDDSALEAQLGLSIPSAKG
jgi:hypothetical protein